MSHFATAKRTGNKVLYELQTNVAYGTLHYWARSLGCSDEEF